MFYLMYLNPFSNGLFKELKNGKHPPTSRRGTSCLPR